MSTKANPTTIGVFVVGAVALAIVVVLVFGSGDLFSKKERYVIFFADSVNGLTVGSAGQDAGGEDRGGEVHPRLLRRGRRRVHRGHDREPGGCGGGHRHDSSRHATQKGSRWTISSPTTGLRAQLALQSLVLGQLYVNIDYFPDTEAVLTGLNRRYYEVPSIPQSGSIQADIERVVDMIVDLPLEETVTRLNSVLGHVDSALAGVELAKLFHEAELTLVETARAHHHARPAPRAHDRVAHRDVRVGAFDHRESRLSLHPAHPDHR